MFLAQRRKIKQLKKEYFKHFENRKRKLLFKRHHKCSDTWKIRLTIANNFISSIENDEERAMHSKIDNLEIVINDEADEIVK